VHAVSTYLDLETATMTTTTTAPAPLGNTPTAPANPTARTADDFADYPRDQWDRPLIVQLNPDGTPVMIWDKQDQKYAPLMLPYTRSSRAGSVLEYEGALNSHKLRTAVIGLTLREDLYYLAKSIPEPGGRGRSDMDKNVIKPAQAASGADTAKIMGTAVHSFAEKLDRKEPVPALGPYQGTLDAYAVLTRGWRWHGIECRLISDRFRMAGKADRIGSPPGFMVAPDGTIITPDDRLVLDLKTSSSDRYFGVKFAVQLCVYAWGDLYDLETWERTPTGARRDWALVIHVPSGGNSGALHWVNLKRGAELVALAREVLDAQGERGLVTKIADGAIYATLEEAQAAAALVTGGGEAGQVLVPEPAADPDEGDPEPSTAQDPALPMAVRVDGDQAQHEAAAARADAASFQCDVHRTYGVGSCSECAAADVAATAEVTGQSELEVEAAEGPINLVPGGTAAELWPPVDPPAERERVDRAGVGDRGHPPGPGSVAPARARGRARPARPGGARARGDPPVRDHRRRDGAAPWPAGRPGPLDRRARGRRPDAGLGAGHHRRGPVLHHGDGAPPDRRSGGRLGPVDAGDAAHGPASGRGHQREGRRVMSATNRRAGRVFGMSACVLVLMLVVLVVLLSACAPGPGDAAGPGQRWQGTGVDGITTACTDQGDRLYAYPDVGAIAVAPGGCRP
jgi:hypothetical protein